MARRPNLICPGCKCKALELTDYQKEYTLATVFNKHGGKRVVVEWECPDCGARIATEYSLTAILDHY